MARFSILILSVCLPKKDLQLSWSTESLIINPVIMFVYLVLWDYFFLPSPSHMHLEDSSTRKYKQKLISLGCSFFISLTFLLL